ncbi:copper resistance protein CopC [Indiicoccus explosivorum]|uniref:copper resistance protein CopC n=1 Tax=Indiicoccus explosivorum TaxID=1917864 RepID=UPI000B43025D|nr:copper resistance protein CopC [Indiicoccus explosivorum]
MVDIRKVILLVLLLAVPAAAVSAHSSLEETIPAANETVSESPEVLEFHFRDPVTLHPGSVVLTSSGGEEIRLAGTSLDERDPSKVIAQIGQPLAPGSYTATVSVVTPDGYVMEEKLSFRVAEQETESAGQPLELISHSPAAGTITDAAPEEIELRFNQPVTLTAVGVFDDREQPVAITGDAVTDPADPARVVIGLPDDLEKGTYQVIWHARPTDPETPVPDTMGSFYFASEVYTAIQSEDGIDETAFDLFGNAGIKQAGYWLWFTGLLAIFGLLFFRTSISRSPVSEKRGAAAIILFILTAAGIFTVLAVQKSELPDLSLPAFGGLKFVWVPLLQLILLAVAISWRRAGPVLAAAALLLVPLVSGHAIYPKYGGAISAAVSALHLLSAGIWFGGLLGLILFLKKFRKGEVPEGVLLRFSKCALISIGTVILTGLYMAGTFVPSFSIESFLGSDWGLAVAIKIGFTFLVLIVGFIQRKAIRRYAERAAGQIGNRAKAETVYGIIILLAASLLVVSTPKAAEQGLYPETTEQEGLVLQAEMEPVEVGLNELVLSFSGRYVEKAAVNVTMPPHFENEFQAFRTGDGEFRVTGDLLHGAGTTYFTVTAVTEDGRETVFGLEAAAPGDVYSEE